MKQNDSIQLILGKRVEEKEKEMNAFRRGHAITGLEELSFVICLHLVLAESFHENQSVKHWRGEITAFEGTLRQWDKGKKGAKNYTPEIIYDALSLVLSDDDQQELIEGAVEAKGLSPENIAWEKAMEAGREFARKVCFP